MGEKKRKSLHPEMLVPVDRDRPIAIGIQSFWNPAMSKYEIVLQMGGFETERDKDEAVKEIVAFVEENFGSERVEAAKSQ